MKKERNLDFDNTPEEKDQPDLEIDLTDTPLEDIKTKVDEVSLQYEGREDFITVVKLTVEQRNRLVCRGVIDAQLISMGMGDYFRIFCHPSTVGMFFVDEEADK